jgi:hypothetical protein
LYKQQETKGVLWITSKKFELQPVDRASIVAAMCPLAFPLIGGTYGDAKSASNLLADKGELAVEVSSAQPREIRVTPNLFVDCRFKGDSREGRSMGYGDRGRNN